MSLCPVRHQAWRLQDRAWKAERKRLWKHEIEPRVKYIADRREVKLCKQYYLIGEMPDLEQDIAVWAGGRDGDIDFNLFYLLWLHPDGSDDCFDELLKHIYQLDKAYFMDHIRSACRLFFNYSIGYRMTPEEGFTGGFLPGRSLGIFKALVGDGVTPYEFPAETRYFADVPIEAQEPIVVEAWTVTLKELGWNPARCQIQAESWLRRDLQYADASIYFQYAPVVELAITVLTDDMIRARLDDLSLEDDLYRYLNALARGEYQASPERDAYVALINQAIAAGRTGTIFKQLWQQAQQQPLVSDYYKIYPFEHYDYKWPSFTPDEIKYDPMPVGLDAWQRQHKTWGVKRARAWKKIKPRLSGSFEGVWLHCLEQYYLYGRLARDTTSPYRRPVPLVFLLFLHPDNSQANWDNILAWFQQLPFEMQKQHYIDSLRLAGWSSGGYREAPHGFARSDDFGDQVLRLYLTLFHKAQGSLIRLQGVEVDLSLYKYVPGLWVFTDGWLFFEPELINPHYICAYPEVVDIAFESLCNGDIEPYLVGHDASRDLNVSIESTFAYLVTKEYPRADFKDRYVEYLINKLDHSPLPDAIADKWARAKAGEFDYKVK